VTAIEPRVACGRCRRPVAVCFCDRITLLPTRTRVLLLQHTRERRMGIGTARLAHLALPGSELRVGVDFSADRTVQAWLARPSTYVLFPGPQAQPIETLSLGPDAPPLTLVVLDGTWAQARKLLALNPAVAALPRVAFSPRRPSAYLIRRQPADFCLSTIEALAEVLERLEPGNPSFERLLDPFRAMVQRQRWYETAIQSSRHRRTRARSPRRPGLAERLAAEWPRLVCFQGEANAWGRADPDRQDPETVHWVAHRPASGETFAAVIAPRRPLAPATPTHIQLGAEVLRAGIDGAAWRARWQAFLRPDDVLVGWGTFYRDLAVGDGLPLPPAFRDLRAEVTRLLRRRVGTVEDCARALDAAPAALGQPGRAGRRLDTLVAAVAGLRARAGSGP
jgi:DTW domain-containing protein YfiP